MTDASPIPKNPVIACHHCGQPWMTPETHHCPGCGMHRSCDACRHILQPGVGIVGKAGLCSDATSPHIVFIGPNVRDRRAIVAPAIPTANEIRWRLGLPRLHDGGRYGPMQRRPPIKVTSTMAKAMQAMRKQRAAGKSGST